MLTSGKPSGGPLTVFYWQIYWQNEAKGIVPELLCYLRDISDKPATPIPGSSYLLRTINVNKIIGFDIKQVPTTYITIVTDSNGWILTAFPGKKLNNSTRKEPLL